MINRDVDDFAICAIVRWALSLANCQLAVCHFTEPVIYANSLATSASESEAKRLNAKWVRMSHFGHWNLSLLSLARTRRRLWPETNICRQQSTWLLIIQIHDLRVCMSIDHHSALRSRTCRAAGDAAA